MPYGPDQRERAAEAAQTLSANILSMLKARGLSPHAIIKQCGFRPRDVAKLKAGKFLPKLGFPERWASMDRLCKLLGVDDVNALYGVQKPLPPAPKMAPAPVLRILRPAGPTQTDAEFRQALERVLADPVKGGHVRALVASLDAG